MSPPLHVRWLGTVPYREAHSLQRGLFAHGCDDYLLLLEHPHVYTAGVRAEPANMLVDPTTVGADFVEADRGGDLTYHGPGQLVGYPILTVPGKRGGGMADTVAYVRSVEQLVIDALTELGLPETGRVAGFPGVWADPGSEAPRKIAAIGVRLSRGRSMHGFALNVAPDLEMFDHIVPCGIAGKSVTSVAAEGCDASMREVVDVFARLAAARWGTGGTSRADVAWRVRPSDLSPFSRGAGPGEVVRPTEHGTNVRLRGRLAAAGVDEGRPLRDRKPDWLRPRVSFDRSVLGVKATMRELDLVTVCEEAGCPNLSECWSDGTATFMLAGERCTRACGFCLVDTRKPLALDPGEPERVAEAVDRMDLEYVVLTSVARDDLGDGGASQFAATIAAVRTRRPHARVEVLIPDCRGDVEALRVIIEARPDVLNHNLETVARLQRAVRPSAGYARSLAVLARAKAAGLVTKSGLVTGMGESDEEVHEALSDLRGVGVDIVTIGQYLRPTSHHLPVDRWVPPSTFVEWKAFGEQLGIEHVESSPLTRSSYHARGASDAAGVVPVRLSVPS
ncbi:MAG TPA: lipoyl synthase [Acidimicrobiales bacterium]|nr:lipoyl synthase [Acidimicrobiales bacterium]